MKIKLPSQNIIGIDPGPIESATVALQPDGRVLEAGMHANEELLWHVSMLPHSGVYHLVVETMNPMGSRVGMETFQAQLWAGAFWGQFDDGWRHRLTRGEVHRTLRTKTDADVHARCLELLGFRSDKEAGTRKKGGALYGVTGTHCWSALGAALAWALELSMAVRAHEDKTT